ncbi:ferredoxin Fer [Halorarum salinum]|uniref:2Fe-2S iron-sulfur cluster binding domain-containing protein n=1 Tax=Halorarum salinum TaxID=2743089 RepID=A0A7D5L9E3_9EURY|nr:ferredoxin Fer [Halobaculum salinum]QLG61188.1 2Fe-2S iron-sulfur cluster binding domain-containing protein [Halobaculum salinum]
MDSPFDVLRVDPDADEEELDRAYRRRVIETHPDQGGSAEEFRRVRAAYERIVASDGEPPEDLEVEAEPTTAETPETTVEYLDYEVLDDHGWALDDDDLFEKAAAADLDAVDHGEFTVEAGETLLEAAENSGFAWPYACRGGACANCAVAVTEGELSQPVDHILPPEMTDRGIRLSCNGMPTTAELSVVYNVKHIPELDELRLPPHPFERAYPTE